MARDVGRDRRNLYGVILTNNIARQIVIKGAMTLRANIGPMVDNLVRVLIQSA